MSKGWLIFIIVLLVLILGGLITVIVKAWNGISKTFFINHSNYTNSFYANIGEKDIQTAVNEAREAASKNNIFYPYNESDVIDTYQEVYAAAGTYTGPTLKIANINYLNITGPQGPSSNICTLSIDRNMLLDYTASNINVNSLKIQNTLFLASEQTNNFTNCSIFNLTIKDNAVGTYNFNNCTFTGLITVPSTFKGTLSFFNCDFKSNTFGFSFGTFTTPVIAFYNCVNLPENTIQNSFTSSAYRLIGYIDETPSDSSLFATRGFINGRPIQTYSYSTLVDPGTPVTVTPINGRTIFVPSEFVGPITISAAGLVNGEFFNIQRAGSTVITGLPFASTSLLPNKFYTFYKINNVLVQAGVV